MTPVLQNTTPFILLRANRETLLRESKQWMDSLTFLSQEMDFYWKMLKFMKCNSDNETLHRGMKSIAEVKLPTRIDNLKNALHVYHQNLEKWSDAGNGILDWNYEEEHRRLRERVERLKVEIQLFKKSAFSYIPGLYIDNATIKFV